MKSRALATDLVNVLAQRNPMLLFLLFGLFLLREAQRALLRLLFHEPPRTFSSSAPLKDHLAQQPPAQTPGVGMASMADPALYALLHMRQGYGPLTVVPG